MTVEEAVREWVPRHIRERGDDYFSRGRVRRVNALRDGSLQAIVVGSEPYSVDLTLRDRVLEVSCHCRFYEDRGEVCKHIWAAIRASVARKLLDGPVEDLFCGGGLVSGNAPVPSKIPRKPDWERFFDAIPRASSRSAFAGTTVPEEIAYVASTGGGLLTLRIRGRSRKKSGEWGKWKDVSLPAEQLQELDAFDHETLGLLTSTYALRTEVSRPIAPSMTRWWVERLARAGRLFVEHDDGLVPVRWDDSGAWDVRMELRRDEEAGAYVMDAAIVRGDESLPLGEVDRTVRGVALSGDRAFPFNPAVDIAALDAFRVAGRVEIPFEATEELRRRLAEAQLGRMALPPELQMEIVDVAPQPLLELELSAWSADVDARLLFLYEGWRVPADSEQKQLVEGGRVVRRDRAREQTLRGHLMKLPVVSAWGGYVIRGARLAEVLRTLDRQGWLIELGSAPLRVADGIEFEVSSGIDWFDLQAVAVFGDQRMPIQASHHDGSSSVIHLPDGSVGLFPGAELAAFGPLMELGQQNGERIRYSRAQALLIDALLQTRKGNGESPLAALREAISTHAPEPRQEPPTLCGELRPYQRAGLGWLDFLRQTGFGGCLADDMGLGKTVQVLALLESLRAAGPRERPSLVVAPRSLLFNWAAEAARFTPELRVVQHHGPARDRAAGEFADFDLVLTTYATMRLDVAALSEIEFDTVILDEAQAIKNASSQISKAARLLRGRHRLALSGTPIENHLGDLWSLFEFLNPGLLGPSRTFQRLFAAKNSPRENREALARALRPLILRRTKEQVAPELPERIEQTLFCELEGAQRAQYEELRDSYRASLLETVRTSGMNAARMHVLEALLRLRQAACDPALISGEEKASGAKIELLMEELDDIIQSGHRALVFSQFTSLLALVRRELDERKVAYSYLDGKTQKREKVVAEFQSDSGPQLFLISLKAGGLGLNLTNADYVFLLDPWWNPAVEAQAVDRAHRIGRQRPVIAYRLIARDTVEEKIMELQSRKRELADSIISEDNSVLRKLEAEDLEMLLS